MPAPRINMRKLKDALRLKFEGQQSHQQIATALGISKGVVTKYAGLRVSTVGRPRLGPNSASNLACAKSSS